MNRKEISHLSIDLIEEALGKPDQTIVLEKRITDVLEQKITSPKCGQEVKGLIKEELKLVEERIMRAVYEISETQRYEAHMKVSQPFEPLSYLPEIEYTNGSKIILKEGE